MPRLIIGSPADQSSSGARASCSGMVRVVRDGNGLPANSFTSWSLISLYEARGLSSLSACARRKRSEVLVSSLAINSKTTVEIVVNYSHTLHGRSPGLQTGFRSLVTQTVSLRTVDNARIEINVE